MADRHAFRANWKDYNEGIFFVTICCKEKRHLFGNIKNGKMYKNQLGSLADFKISDIMNHHQFVEIHNYIVMPNHVHILLQLLPIRNWSKASNISEKIINTGCLKPPRHGTPCYYNHFNSRLAVIIGGYKAAVTREWKNLFQEERTRQVASLPDDIWQSRFHDHYIRDQFAYDNINNYISTNPENWDKDIFSL